MSRAAAGAALLAALLAAPPAPAEEAAPPPPGVVESTAPAEAPRVDPQAVRRANAGLDLLAQAEAAMAEADFIRARQFLFDAADAFEDAIAGGVHTIPSYLGAARAAGMLGRAAEALDYAEAILASFPGHPDALRESARASLALRDFDSAALDAEAVAQATASPDDWLFVSEVLAASGDRLGAVAAASKALDAHPGHARAGRRLVELLARYGIDAEPVLVDLVTAYPRQWLYHVLLADELRRGGDVDEARRHYALAHDLAPGEPDPILRLLPLADTPELRARRPEFRQRLAALRAEDPSRVPALVPWEEFEHTDHFVRVFENIEPEDQRFRWLFIVSEHPDFPAKRLGTPTVRVALQRDRELQEAEGTAAYDLLAGVGDRWYWIGEFGADPDYAAVRERVEDFLLGSDAVPMIPMAAAPFEAP